MVDNSHFSRTKIEIILLQIISIISVGIFLFLLFSVIATSIFQKKYEGKIIPGVSISGVDVSGLSIEDASKKINEFLEYPVEGRITLRDQDKTWVVAPIEFGMVINTPETIRQAYQIGREGNIFSNPISQLRAYLDGLDISVIFLYDERVTSGYLQRIASEIEKPVIEAKLFLDGKTVVSSNGKIGRLLKIDVTLINISEALKQLKNCEIPLIIDEVNPSVLNVEPQAIVLQSLLNSPLIIKLPEQSMSDPGPWIIEPIVLSNMLKIEKVFIDETAEFQLGIYDSQLIPLLEEIERTIERNSQNARFIFNDDTRQLDLIQNAVVGRKMNLENTLKNFHEGLFTGGSEIKVALDIDPPQVGDNATAADLGITQLVVSESTYFRGSSNERIHNIRTASSQFHGILIAPGQTFSMSDALGDISLDNGYAEALIIYDNRTITGVGGGVCQVSTTLFRTVFKGGYPVVERHPHAYRVGYYEQIYSGGKDIIWAGLDATVYVPLVDFKFTNDSQFWLLMETYVNVQAKQLTWKFYSTNDGRTVKWDTTGLQNIKPAPDPIFQENPELGLTEMKQVDWSAEGADVTITRTVMKDGRIYFEDSFYTSYNPWQAICQHGTGVTDPESEAAEKGICQ